MEHGETKIGRLPRTLRVIFDVLREYKAEGAESRDKVDQLHEIFWDQVFRHMPTARRYSNLHLREGYIIFGVPEMDKTSRVRMWLNRVTHVY